GRHRLRARRARRAHPARRDRDADGLRVQPAADRAGDARRDRRLPAGDRRGGRAARGGRFAVTGASVDPYRSRGSDRWELAERCDPVVWGTGAPGPLSGEQIAEYRDRGFLVFPRLFAANEVAALLAETERMAAAADRSRDDVIVEPGGDAVRSIFRMHRDSAMIRALAADPRLAGAARQILGGEVYIHQSRVNFK